MGPVYNRGKNQSLAVVIGRFHCTWIRNEFNIWNVKNANLETEGRAKRNIRSNTLYKTQISSSKYIISAFIL
jgi:hypothetical protein